MMDSYSMEWNMSIATILQSSPHNDVLNGVEFKSYTKLEILKFLLTIS